MGGGFAPQLTLMTEALASSTTIFVLYNAEVDAADFEETDFITSPNGRVPNVISNDSPSTLSIEFAVDVEDQAELNYSGDAPGVQTPQTISITL